MKIRLEDKIKAINLRLEGKTYGDILSVIPDLSKGTLSGWLSDIKLSPNQNRRLEKRLQEVNANSRLKYLFNRRQKKEKRIAALWEEGTREYSIFSKNTLFKIGLTLYWAEGAKKYQIFQFTNSDPNAVILMIRWIDEILGFSKDKIKIRLFIHRIYANEHCEKYWSKLLGIPISSFQKTIFKPTPHKIKKNPDYKGCVQIRVPKTDAFWKVMGWINNLIKEYNT